MKKLFFSAFLAACAGFGVAGCSNGDYDANPDTNNSGGVNPLNPTGGMNTDFNWGGTDPMSLELNGKAWKADDASSLIWTDNKHIFIGGMNYTSGADTSNCTLYLNLSTKPGDIVYVFSGNTDNSASFSTKISDENQEYASTSAPFGAVKILENDATHMKGLFYFLARAPRTGQYINIQKGYFNVNKP